MSHPAGTIPGMKTVELHNWRIRSSVTGRIYRSRHKMTSESALALDPQAQSLADTRELREVAETEDEKFQALYGRWPGTKF